MGCNVKTIQFNRRGKNPVQELKLAGKIIKHIRKIEPTFILTYTIKANIYAGIGAQLLRMPYAANITGLGIGVQSEISKKYLLSFTVLH